MFYIIKISIMRKYGYYYYISYCCIFDMYSLKERIYLCIYVYMYLCTYVFTVEYEQAFHNIWFLRKSYLYNDVRKVTGKDRNTIVQDSAINSFDLATKRVYVKRNK